MLEHNRKMDLKMKEMFPRETGVELLQGKALSSAMAIAVNSLHGGIQSRPNFRDFANSRDPEHFSVAEDRTIRKIRRVPFLLEKNGVYVWA